MTNKEAIIILKENSVMRFPANTKFGDWNEWNKALNMAIAALEEKIKKEENDNNDELCE